MCGNAKHDEFGNHITDEDIEQLLDEPEDWDDDEEDLLDDWLEDEEPEDVTEAIEALKERVPVEK